MLAKAETSQQRNWISNHFYSTNCYLALEKISAEIEKHLGQPWRDLRQINDGFVAVHTMLVLWRLI
jgi:hypothetical protein